MPNPPPPPPPGPPPPPMFAAPAAASGGAADDGQVRNMLLSSIRQGAQLKKTVTVDKSAPLLGGAKRASPTSAGPRNNGPAAAEAPRNNGAPMDMGSLFAGGMPKLRSTGRNIGVSPRSNDSNDSARNYNDNSPVINSHQKQKSLGSRRELTPDTKNRGPPPQPPPSNKKPTMHVSTSDTALTSSSPSPSQRSAAPSLPSKPPVGGHGKPNFAPRPPGQYKTAPKPSPPPKSTNAMQVANGPPSLPSRPPSVARATSMRTPRSPSADSSPSPELGDYRGQHHFQSQEGLHNMSNGMTRAKSAAPLPPGVVGGGRNPPPLPPQSSKTKPPASKPPPPPVSSRITPPVLPPPPPPTAAPPPPSSAPPPPATAPPLPPHRLTAASQQKSQPPPPPLSVPPPPPVRNSSMRNGVVAANGELEGRFIQMFRKVHEFPAPEKFLNVPKVYNSRNDSSSSAHGSSRRSVMHTWDLASKQQAPQPPNMHVQLSNKMWANDTSSC